MFIRLRKINNYIILKTFSFPIRRDDNLYVERKDRLSQLSTKCQHN